MRKHHNLCCWGFPPLPQNMGYRSESLQAHRNQSAAWYLQVYWYPKQRGRAKNFPFKIIQHFQLSLTADTGVTLTITVLIHHPKDHAACAREFQTQKKWFPGQTQPEAVLRVGLHGDHQQPRLPSPHFPARGSSQNKGDGKSPCKNTCPSALRCPNSSTIEQEELHSGNTDRVWFSSHDGKPGINALSFHKLVLRAFLP